MSPTKRKITSEKTSEKVAAQAALSAAETAKLPVIRGEDVAAAVLAEEASGGDSPAPDETSEKPKRRLRMAKGSVRAKDASAEGARPSSPSAPSEEAAAAGGAAAEEGAPPEGESRDQANDATAAAAEADDRSRKPSVRASRAKAGAGRIAGIVVCIVACALVVCFGLLAWNRWLRFDDAADIAGTWTVPDSGATIEIDGSTIVLGPDARLSYEIDPFAKTIAFDLGDMAGEARYRFSDDRDQIAFVDGGDSWFSTFSDDLAHALAALFAQVTGGEELPLSEDPSAVVLTRAGAAPSDADADAAEASAEGAAGEGAASADAESAQQAGA